jgi:hypothetical protein
MSVREVLEIFNETDTPKEDPVLSNFSLPLRAVFYPLGFAVEIATNSGDVLIAAEESWGRFRKTFSEPPVRMEIGVTFDGSKECPAVPECRSRANLITTLADPDNFAVCDLSRGFGFAWVTQGTAKNRAYFRYYFLEASVLMLLEGLYTRPVHAACVQSGSKGILLCGESGAGKSSLAFACARAGWKFLTDDGTAIVRNRPGRVVVGNPHQMRFRESAIDLFPELLDQSVAARANGKVGIELATANLPGIETITECAVEYIVFLNRRDPGSFGLFDRSPEEALQYFEKCINFGEEKLRELQRSSINGLLTAKIFEMRYGDLDWAVDRLAKLVMEGA